MSDLLTDREKSASVDTIKYQGGFISLIPAYFIKDNCMEMLCLQSVQDVYSLFLQHPKYDGFTISCNIYFNTHLYTWTMELYIRYTVMKLMCDLPYILCAIDLFFAPHTSVGFLCSVTCSVYSCIEMSFSFQII